MVNNAPKEMRLKEFFLLTISWLEYLKRNWIILLVFAVIFCLAGAIRSYFAKPVYKAVSTFVLEEEKSSQIGGLAALALDGEAQGGLFQGDNLKWLYSTRLMIQKALFTKVKHNSKQEDLLINWFLVMDSDILEIKKKTKEFQTLTFSDNDENDSLQNNVAKSQLLNNCVGILKSKYIKVKDVDKTEGVIEVSVESKDEHFAKNLSDVLIEKVNQYYIQTKTLKTATQVASLQNQANEYSKQMNAMMYQTAAAVDAVPYPNPNHQINLVQPKRKGLDAELNSAIYVQIVKNLESAKMELAQATPLIQIVDAPMYPLPSGKPGLLVNAALGAILGFLLASLVLIMRKGYLDVMNTEEPE